ncbi:NAD-dependent protein deacetylase [Lysobacter sp. H21R4]|uniref:NAD-dependent protein deacetylase n=1 Tax=Lysobacter sp. H21R4 TaxID=2781021 RepID=UPI0018871720|nr:NAD-dependent protein deacetylase [Lysobacter sp. H21R4]QOY63739.1 NAD-dependent protein deacetylase [Lysobacter sp. H21R4]
MSVPRTDAAADLSSWLENYRSVFVLTGAGVSTNSGIPDYRGADGQWKGRSPITYQQFVGDPAMRARYWARSFVGWPAVARAQPNGAHTALATLESRGVLSSLVTQNVDGLHARAGHRTVVDLHGRLGVVACLQCDRRMDRALVQQDLKARYPHWSRHTAATAPDGDADLEGVDLSGFEPSACPHCGGMLKPDVVFFGENVPRQRLARAVEALEQSDAVLVVGSSLMVYSGFRFARMAHERALPLAILTRGVTRADELATLKLDADTGATLVNAVG